MICIVFYVELQFFYVSGTEFYLVFCLDALDVDVPFPRAPFLGNNQWDGQKSSRTFIVARFGANRPSKNLPSFATEFGYRPWLSTLIIEFGYRVWL